MFPEGRILDFIIVGAVALMVVGPKDLPILMRKVGQFVARMRGMAAEFRASFDELARQSELDELRKEVEAMRAQRPLDMAAAAVGAKDAELDQVFSDIHSELQAGTAQLNPPMAYQYPTSVEPEPPADPPPTPSSPAEAARDQGRSEGRRHTQDQAQAHG